MSNRRRFRHRSRQSNTSPLERGWGYIPWEILGQNRQDQIGRLQRHPLFGSRLESDVFSLTLADRQQWFEYFTRHQTVSMLDYQCRQCDLQCNLPIAQEIRLEPQSVPLVWRRLFDRDLCAVIFEWSWSGWRPKESVFWSSTGPISLECSLQFFLLDHRDALQPPTAISVRPSPLIDGDSACLPNGEQQPVKATSGGAGGDNGEKQLTTATSTCLPAGDSAHPSGEQQPVTPVELPSGLNYKSPLKRAIAWALIQNPVLTDYQLCGLLDEQESVDLPWKRNPRDRSFLDAYKDKERKGKLQTVISKVRRDMRKVGLLKKSSHS